MPTVIDTAVNTTRYLPKLKQAGIKTIIRYINPLGFANEKTVKPAEARAIAAAGMRLGLVCEGYGGTRGMGVDGTSGERDAMKCLEYAPGVGIQDNACIYYAVDVDATPSYIRNQVVPYFQNIRRLHNNSKYRVGIYGCGAACKAITEARLADLGWLSCSTGWAGFKDYLNSNKWSMRQHCDTNVAGFGNDTDDVNGDIGDFVPWGLTGDDMPVIIPEATPHQIAEWLQMCLVKLHHDLAIDGDIGPASMDAIKKEFYS